MRDSDIFIREDLSRPENRINVAMFGMMLAPEFSAWLAGRLSLPSTAVMFPPVNTANDAGAGRPDFEIRESNSGRTIGYIEVECAKNHEQIARFRAMFPDDRVIAIWGRPGADCDLSLEEIAEFLGAAREWSSPQARVNAAHLRKLINDALTGAKASRGRTSVGDEMWNSPLITALREATSGRLERRLPGQGPLRPGDLGLDTTDTANNRGYSLRVYSGRSGSNASVSIFNRTGGRAEIRFSSQEWLDYYLPAHGRVVDELRRLVHELGGDITLGHGTPRGTKPRSNLMSVVAIARVEERVDQLARILTRLADRPDR